jgi:NNP family nitrate/nitrite transporter-like MFS transporter
MYWLIVLFGILVGSGIAIFSPGIAQTSYWYPKEKQGIALGVYAGLGNLAPGLLGIFLPVALHALGLTTSYIIWLGFLLLGTAIYWIFTHDAYYFQLIKKGKKRAEAQEIAEKLGEELIPSGSTLKSLKISAKIPSTWGLVFLYFTSFGGFLALTVWFPTYWVKNYQFDLREGGLLMALGFSLLSSLIRVWGGHISDKFGGERIAILSYVTVLIGAFVIFFSHSFGISLTGEIIIGAGMGIANAAVFKLVPKYVPTATGGAAGWVGGLGAFGGFIVPPILGIFVDHYGNAGYAKGFIVYVIMAIISIIISSILLRVHRNKATF